MVDIRYMYYTAIHPIILCACVSLHAVLSLCHFFSLALAENPSMHHTSVTLCVFQHAQSNTQVCVGDVQELLPSTALRACTGKKVPSIYQHICYLCPHSMFP